MTAVEHNGPQPHESPTTRTTSFRYDWNDDEPLSTAVVSAVETLSGTEPVELAVLYDRIDPDALEAIFEPRADDARRDDGQVRFAFAGCEVTVYGDGFVVVRRLE